MFTESGQSLGARNIVRIRLYINRAALWFRPTAKRRTSIKRVPQQRFLLLCLLTNLLAGCIATPGGSVYNATNIVYTEGASQHTVAVELPAAARDVFNSMSRIVDQLVDIEIVNRNGETLSLEIVVDKKRLTGRATDLSDGETLLFVWADTRISGETSLATRLLPS